MVLIGIDPGLQHTGLAMWDGERLYGLATMPAGHALSYVLQHPPESVVVYVEDPGLHERLWWDNKGAGKRDGARALRIARSVGRNEGAARVIIDTLRARGYHVVTVRPDRGTGSKIPSGQFARITGYRARCSQHARDAAMLIYGRATPPAPRHRAADAPATGAPPAG
ncbi:MAG: hypothetical protein KatS3mg051_1912 [Anaerolineae bacterium]|nr:MAG: hypothetical protein KatS3mg051_1912 [Anaerolineae bacterium]